MSNAVFKTILANVNEYCVMQWLIFASFLVEGPPFGQNDARTQPSTLTATARACIPPLSVHHTTLINVTVSYVILLGTTNPQIDVGSLCPTRFVRTRTNAATMVVVPR